MRLMLDAIALIFAALTGAAAPPRVSTSPDGVVAGSAAPGGGALLFRGIPFAAPPIGERRWRAPAPVVPWQGPRAATGPRRRPACRTTMAGIAAIISARPRIA
jgi:para-nitrobenzyl esterase